MPLIYFMPPSFIFFAAAVGRRIFFIVDDVWSDSHQARSYGESIHLWARPVKRFVLVGRDGAAAAQRERDYNRLMLGRTLRGVNMDASAQAPGHAARCAAIPAAARISIGDTVNISTTYQRAHIPQLPPYSTTAIPTATRDGADLPELHRERYHFCGFYPSITAPHFTCRRELTVGLRKLNAPV